MGYAEELSARCCIAGGGPAGMMLGYLLARAGIDVVVLEKHADFLRDFRGDTIHPSTLEVMAELGLLDAFLARPHDELREVAGQIGEALVTIADFSHLPTRCKFVAFVPQWHFLNFLAEEARRYPSFRLMMESEATALVRAGGRVVGVIVRTPRGPLSIGAELVVACDGRHSTLRREAGLEVTDLGAPIDVLWFRLSKRPDDPTRTLGRFASGRVLVMLDRGDYWQCAFVIRKGGFDRIREQGLLAFRGEIAVFVPDLADRVEEIATWDDVKLLTVTVDRLRRWHRPGLLCIGDAAHAMSPIGGVGINLAIQDAVAAANILVPALKEGGAIPEAVLASVQRRRELPTRLTQRLQILIQNRVLSRVLATASGPFAMPLPLRLIRRYPALRRIPARILGMGFRPEHVRLPGATRG
jgi:2-polyprenyl-6-methoxyphenol hydroxylase-like FAD-dependent oxidoreductase